MLSVVTARAKKTREKKKEGGGAEEGMGQKMKAKSRDENIMAVLLAAVLKPMLDAVITKN